jgi:UPF0716 family protein affecting phage T7 exclusion
MSIRLLRRPDGLISRISGLVAAIRDGDDTMVEDAVTRLSQQKRWLAPLAFAVGALAMLFEGLRLVFTNWRLTLIQILPASWIWLATFDLKLHLLHGRQLNVLRGPILIPLVIAIAAITAACFFLNAVFAFAIADSETHEVRPAMREARRHLGVVLGSGFVVGLALAFATLIAARFGPPWFTLSLGIVIGVMMLCYVLIPSRLIGAKPVRSRRDKVIASAVSGAFGAVICTPPYLLGRIGVLMLGSRALLIPGIIFMAVGFALQAGATGAVKAIKMSTKLVAGRSADDESDRGVSGQGARNDRGERGDHEPEQADHADRVRPSRVGDRQPSEAGDQQRHRDSRQEAGPEVR